MIARHARVVIDLGAGDGKQALRRARRNPTTLVIAVEPVAAALAEASRHAARAARKGGQPNALFLAGTAEELPWLLRDHADEVTVALPWGALLQGVLHPGDGTADRLRRTLRPAGELTLLLSLTDTDQPAAGATLDRATLERLAADYTRLGLDCLELRPATTDDVAALSSSWGRRLGIPERRPGWLLRFRSQAGPGACSLGGRSST